MTSYETKAVCEAAQKAAMAKEAQSRVELTTRRVSSRSPNPATVRMTKSMATSSSVESSGRIETIIAAIYARKSHHEMSRSEEDP